jgi:hypothetical protein
MKTETIFTMALLTVASVGLSQGTFQDLNFENANPVSFGSPYPSAYVTTGSALPGWQAFIGTMQTPVVVLDGISTGGAGISIINNDPSLGGHPLDGNYSAFLFGGGNNPLYSASLSQTGTVPAGTESLLFDGYVSGAPFSVVLGGQPIAMSPLQAFAHYTLWGGNIPSSLAGQSETLTFTEPPATGVQPSMFELDDIMFSPSPIMVTPEPSPLLLTAIGGILFGIHRRFARKGE